MSQMYALICVVSIFYSRNVLFTGGVLYWWGLHGYIWKQFCRYQGDVPICWTFLYKLCYLVEGTLFFCSSFHPSSFFTIFYICFLCSSSSSSSFPILNSLSFLQNLLFPPTLFGLFFTFLLETCPFLWPLITLFQNSGFQSQGGQLYSHLSEVYVIYIP